MIIMQSFNNLCRCSPMPRQEYGRLAVEEVYLNLLIIPFLCRPVVPQRCTVRELAPKGSSLLPDLRESFVFSEQIA